jgi:hypothetical protein
MAIQQVLGLLPERWIGISGGNSTGAGSGRALVEIAFEGRRDVALVVLHFKNFSRQGFSETNFQ